MNYVSCFEYKLLCEQMTQSYFVIESKESENRDPFMCHCLDYISTKRDWEWGSYGHTYTHTMSVKSERNKI